MDVLSKLVEREVLPLALRLVLLLECASSLLVVSRDRIESLIRNSLFEHLRVKHADQAVAAFDVVIEKAKGFPVQCPSSHKASLQRSTAKWIHVHPVNALGNHITNRKMKFFRCRLVFPGLTFANSRPSLLAAASRKWPEPQAGSHTLMERIACCFFSFSFVGQLSLADAKRFCMTGTRALSINSRTSSGLV